MVREEVDVGRSLSENQDNHSKKKGAEVVAISSEDG